MVDLTQFSWRIYEEPLSAIRASGRIANLTDPICVAMLIVDFETEVSMNGILGFLGNSSGLYGKETLGALREIGCADAAATLGKILATAELAGMTHDAIQADRQQLQPYAVTTFRSLHGPKWEDATARVHELADDLDFSFIMDHLEAYMELHRRLFEEALS